MSKRFAHILNGVIADTIIADDAFVASHPLDWIECPDQYGIGHLYDPVNGYSYPPAPPVLSQRIGTKLWFRSKFTAEEQEWADELEATFEANAGLTPEQKRKLRTGFKNFNLANDVDLDDPRILPMLQLYVDLGGLQQHRIAQILA